MKKFILSFFAIFMPAIALLLMDDPIGAIIALILQASIIGWIPASIWVWRSIPRKMRASPPPKTPGKDPVKRTSS